MTHQERFTLSSVVNVAKVPQRSPFRYPGGKTWLVPHIRTWMMSLDEKPRVFAEPFAGGGIVGLTVAFEGLARKTVLVELDKDVAAVWQAILDGDAERLGKRILEFQLTPERAKAFLSMTHRTREERAFATILRNRVQHGGIMASGAGFLNKGEAGRGIRSRWYPQTLHRRIMDIAAISNRISFRCGDGIEFVRKNGQKDGTVFFIDPPYTMAGRRLYTCSHINHEELFEVVSKATCEFLITYDESPEIRALARKHGFECKKVAMKSRLHSKKKELLIGRDLNWTARLSLLRSEPSSL